jgi:hypothetical protein
MRLGTGTYVHHCTSPRHSPRPCPHHSHHLLLQDLPLGEHVHTLSRPLSPHLQHCLLSLLLSLCWLLDLCLHWNLGWE